LLRSSEMTRWADAVEKVGGERRWGLAIGLIWELYAHRGF